MTRHGVLGDQRGATTVELVLLTPIFAAFAVFITAAGVLTHTVAGVEATAADAARRASLERSPAAAVTAARAAVADHAPMQRCDATDVHVDTTNFRRGGTVTVTVDCRVPFGHLLGLTAPGAKTVTATASEVIDNYRRTDS